MGRFEQGLNAMVSISELRNIVDLGFLCRVDHGVAKGFKLFLSWNCLPSWPAWYNLLMYGERGTFIMGLGPSFFLIKSFVLV